MILEISENALSFPFKKNHKKPQASVTLHLLQQYFNEGFLHLQ